MLDAQSMFSNAQAITASAASTNYFDQGAPGTPPYAAAPLGQDLGAGNAIPIVVEVTTDFATLTSLKVAVEVDDNTSFSSATTVMETEAIPAASLVAGYRFSLNGVPLGTNERYIRLYYTVGGSNATAGAVTAHMGAPATTNRLGAA